MEEAKAIAADIGYPVLVRPSYVLGGRGMEIVYDQASLDDYFTRIEEFAIVGPEAPLLVDRFLDDAVEIDVDALYDGQQLYIGGVMEHIEEAGIHSGDSACTLPPVTLGRDVVDKVCEAVEKLAQGIGVKGLINVQFAVAAGVLYVLEANPRASRTVPFVSKALGIQLARAASLVMAGSSIASLVKNGVLPKEDGRRPFLDSPVAVKEAVLPFKRFRTPSGDIVDSILGPEMRSTGEVMGMRQHFSEGVCEKPRRCLPGACLAPEPCLFLLPIETRGASFFRYFVSASWGSTSSRPREQQKPLRDTDSFKGRP